MAVLVAGGKAKTAAKRGRKQLAEDSLMPVTVVLSDSASPTKRRKSGNHYSDGESSPSKKRATQSKENEHLDFEGRGMLFGVDPKQSKAEEDLDLGTTVVEKPVEKKKKTLARSKSLPKVRLVVGANPKSGGKKKAAAR